jgi:hypothetical protein
MHSRTRSILRWAVGTLIFGTALILLDLALYHFWQLRRPRTAPAEWHLLVAVGSGAGSLLCLLLGARFVLRYPSRTRATSRTRQPSRKRPPPSASPESKGPAEG